MMVPCELKRWILNKEILRMIAAAVFVFNFLFATYTVIPNMK